MMKSTYAIKKLVPQLVVICTILMLLISCDKVVNDYTYLPNASIPKVTTEILKQLYPDVSSFILKPLEDNKIWQSNFVASSGKVVSLLDYQGEIIDINPLVGTTKDLPTAIRQDLLSNYPSAHIIKFYDVVQSTTQVSGYKLTIQNSDETSVNLYYDANATFIRKEFITPSLITGVLLSSTEVISYDANIPKVIKDFIAKNNVKSANIILYTLTTKDYQLRLNFRELMDGTAQSSEIILSSTGSILQWNTANETKISYTLLSKSNLPVDANNYLNTTLSGSLIDYAVTVQSFGKNKTHYIATKKGEKELYLLIDEEGLQANVSIIRMAILTANDLPASLKTELNALFTNWSLTKIRVIYEPYSQKETNPITDKVNHYQLEVTQGNHSYSVRFDKDGNLIFSYQL